MENNEATFLYYWRKKYTLLAGAILFVILGLSSTLLDPKISDQYNYLIGAVYFATAGIVAMMLSPWLALLFVLFNILVNTLETLNIAFLGTTIYYGQIQILIDTFPQGLDMTESVAFSWQTVYFAFWINSGFLFVLMLKDRAEITPLSPKKSLLALLYAIAFFLTIDGKGYSGNSIAASAWLALDAIAMSTSPILKDSPPPPSEEPDINKILLVIGESQDRDLSQLYGYPVKNSPKLSARDDITIIDDLMSTGGFTISVMRKITLLKSVNDGQPHNSIWQYAKSAGYYTARISAGPLSWGHIGELSPRSSLDYLASADDIMNERMIRSVFDLKGKLGQVEDFYWLNLAKEQAQKCGEKCFITLRLLNSHSPIKDVTPKRYFLFEDDYDNSLLYGDDLLDTLLSLEEFKDYTIIFFSDHVHTYDLGGKVMAFVRLPDGAPDSALIANRTKPLTQPDFTYSIIKSMGYRDFPNDFNTYDVFNEVVPEERERTASNMDAASYKVFSE